MKTKLMPILAVGLSLLFVRVLSAQDDWEGKDRFPNNIEAAYRGKEGQPGGVAEIVGVYFIT